MYKPPKLLFLFVFLIGISKGNSQILVKIFENRVCFIEGRDSILTYQASEKSLDGKYPRSNYIHPLYNMDGQILTEDFPEDHPHHRGIFWAWHQLYVGDRRIGDGWEILDFSWEVKKVKQLKQKDDSKAIQTEVVWKSPQWTDSKGKQAGLVRENTNIRVYPARNNYRLIDIQISLKALESEMKIGGSTDEKGYGGFSPRIKLSDDVVFTTPFGKVLPTNLPVNPSPWMDISGSMGNKGALAGLTILCHPENPGFPNPWILRAKKSMQNAVFPFPGSQAVPLSNKKPTLLRYRLIVHQGNVNSIDISSIYADYTSH